MPAPVFSPRDLLPVSGLNPWTGGPARPTTLTFQLHASLTPAEQDAVRAALLAWDDASGLVALEVGPNAQAALRFTRGAAAGVEGGAVTLGGGESFPELLRLTGTALGLDPTAPGADPEWSIMAPGAISTILLPYDREAIEALFQSDSAEPSGVRWSHDAARNALRADILSLTGRDVFGSTGRDAIFGSVAGDRVFGDAGDDLLMGGPGADILMGGAGFDTAAWVELRRDVTVDFPFQRVNTMSGMDQFDGVEHLDFRDGDWALTTAHPAWQVERLYQALLHRAADPQGLATWTAYLERGAAVADLVERIFASAEYLDRFGAPDAAARVRAAEAMSPEPARRLDTPIWVPDEEAMLVVRFHLLTTGAAPSRDAFDAWLDALEAAPGPLAGAEAFLASTGGPFLDGAALLAAAEALPFILSTGAWVNEGVLL